METKKEELERLYRRYYELDKEYDKRAKRRMLLSILLFAAPKLLLIFVFVHKGSVEAVFENIGYFLGFLALSIFYSWLEYLFWFSIFDRNFAKGREEASTLNHIKGRISEVKKELEQEQMKGR